MEDVICLLDSLKTLSGKGAKAIKADWWDSWGYDVVDFMVY
jgi:hypothetical protein